MQVTSGRLSCHFAPGPVSPSRIYGMSRTPRSKPVRLHCVPTSPESHSTFVRDGLLWFTRRGPFRHTYESHSYTPLIMTLVFVELRSRNSRIPDTNMRRDPPADREINGHATPLRMPNEKGRWKQGKTRVKGVIAEIDSMLENNGFSRALVVQMVSLCNVGLFLPKWISGDGINSPFLILGAQCLFFGRNESR